MKKEDRLRLLKECRYPIRADEGTAYPCSQKDLDGLVKFYDSPRNTDYVSPNRGTNKLVQWLDINQNPDPESAAALKRLREGLKLQRWGPDLAIKAFKDLDQTFFMGTLTGNVLVRWKNIRDIVDLWSKGSTYGYTTKMGHGQARITIDPTSHFKKASDPYSEMWQTLLHEMCHAYLFVVCGHCENAPGEPKTKSSGGGHGVHFRRCLHSVDRRADKYLGLTAISLGEFDYFDHI